MLLFNLTAALSATRAKKMKKLGRRVYYKNGTPKFNAWFRTDGNDLIPVDVRRSKDFKNWDEMVYCFRYNERLYTECGIDHFNGHMSNFQDSSAIYGVYLREVIEA